MNAAQHDYEIFRQRLVSTACLSSTGEDCTALFAKLSPHAAEYVGSIMFQAALIVIERQRQEIERLQEASHG